MLHTRRRDVAVLAPAAELDEEEHDSRCSEIVSTVKKSTASKLCACARNPTGRCRCALLHVSGEGREAPRRLLHARTPLVVGKAASWRKMFELRVNGRVR